MNDFRIFFIFIDLFIITTTLLRFLTVGNYFELGPILADIFVLIIISLISNTTFSPLSTKFVTNDRTYFLVIFGYKDYRNYWSLGKIFLKKYKLLLSIFASLAQMLFLPQILGKLEK